MKRNKDMSEIKLSDLIEITKKLWDTDRDVKHNDTVFSIRCISDNERTCNIHRIVGKHVNGDEFSVDWMQQHASFVEIVRYHFIKLRGLDIV